MTSNPDPIEVNKGNSWQTKALSIEWLGQTIASLCWIGSVFVYGITSNGDWLQLIAGVSWFAANIASLKEA